MSKIISVSDEVYGRLKDLKKEESFTFAIKKLLSMRANKEEILEQFGKGGVDEKRMKEIKRGWKKWTEKYA